MEKGRRRNYFIDKPFQTKFIIKFCAIVIVSSMIIGASLFYLSRGFTTVAIESAHVIVKSTSDFMLPITVEILILATVFSAVLVILLTLLTSHKIAGPLYRLKKDIEAFKNGQLNLSFKTRKTDQLQEMAEALSEMSIALTGKHMELKNKLADLKSSLQKPDADKDAVIRKLNELESYLSYFKI